MNDRNPLAPGRIWLHAFERLQAIDRSWSALASDDRARALAEARVWMEDQADAVPRLAALARLLTPEIDRPRFWHVLVPVEREVARHKATDVTILDTDADGALAVPPPMAVSVVADSLRSAMNLGGIFRTAECFGVREIVLTGYSADPASDSRVAAAALGTEQQVPWRRIDRAIEAVARLRGEGLQVVALETVAGAPPPEAFDWRFPCALMLGSERFGLDPDVVAACDGVVRIPLFGRKNSLNVVSAFAVVAHALRIMHDGRQRG